MSVLSLKQAGRAGILLAVALGICHFAKAHAQETAVAPPPAQTQTIVFAGGCFWGVESVFEHTKGVVSAVSGYAGGPASAAHYEDVSSGQTGHAESVEVVFDPAQVTLGQLLDVYFNVAHNPTQLNYQGPDHGTQYRSEIFYTTAAQKEAAAAKIADLQSAHVFEAPVVTKVEKLAAFYPAESYHQDYAAHHPLDPYIVFNDAPKVAKLQKTYPDLYKDETQ